jgi:hypothetical protein
MSRLPDFDKQVDVITAFMTCFNTFEDGRPWGAREWLFFLEDLRPRLREHGRVIIRFNLNPATAEFYPQELPSAVRSLPRYRARFFLHYLFLSAV